METRSRKRAEATSKRPPPAQRSKRARTSSDLPTGSGSRSRFSVRIGSAVGASTTATASKHQFGMDSAHESAGTSTGSGSRASRRDKDKVSKREHEKDDDRGSEKVLRGAGGAEKETEKGKEKEQEKDGGRDRDKVAAALGDVDEENEGEAVGTISQNLASASSALHGLLRKLGAGLDELLPSTTASAHQSTRLKRILSGLRAEGEEGRQLESLSQLCELLSIGTEESLSSFSVDSFVPVLVNLLSHDYNPDVMLLAARALTHLCDVLPSSCAAVVHYGAVPHFCARLLTIEYIDLAEQSLQALEKISHEHPSACLRSGALMAVLSYLDFFSTGVQRVAVSTAANICRQLPSDSTDIVMMAVPILTTLLQNQDSKVVEHASVCLTRIADSFANSAEKIDQLCSYDLIQLTVNLISVSSANGSTVSQTSLSTSTYTGLIRLLSTCASGSAGATEGLLQSNISKTLKDVLVGASFVSSTCTAPSSVARPPEQLYEIMSLVNELLPPIREVSSSTSASEGRSSGRKGHGSSSNRSEVPCNSDISPREKFLSDHPELLLQFGADLFSVLVQVYGSSVSSSVRHKCLAAINKLMHFSTAEMLSTLSKESNISSFLASVLASKDPSVLMMSLSIADLLMQKLPALFSKLFVKEGVVHALDLLISSDQTGSQQASPSGRNIDGSSSSVKPRRVPSRRRPTGSNVDAMPEDPGGSNVGVVGSPPTGSEQVVQPSRGGLQAAVILKAKQLKDTYFSADVGLVTGVSDSLCKLKDLCAKLNADGLAEVKGKGKGKARTIPLSPSCDEHMISVISDILTELGNGDGVSTFEFVGSGVVDALLKFLSCGGMSKDNASENATFRLRQQVLRRFKRFLELSLPLEHDGQKELPLTVLVRKIQNALGSLERFPVILSHGPRASGGAASIAAGLSALTQPFKLRLCRAPADKLLRDYSSNIVLIEPLATLAAVEEFLWPRVRKHDGSPTSAAAASSSDGVGSPTTVAPSTSTSTSAPAANEHRPSTRSRTVLAAASSKEPESGASKGKAKVSSSSKASPVVDHQGPETRNAAARRKAEAAVSAASKQTPLDDHVDSDDDELDVSPVEIEEAVAMDEDDLSDDGDDDDDDHEEVFGEEAADVCIGDRVHDVQLGDGTEVAGAVSTSATTSESPSQPSSIFGTGLAGAARAALLKPGIEASGSRAAGIGTRGSLSFAAALGGTASPSANGARSSRDRRSLVAMSASNAPPRLAFFLGGKQLNRSLTIFQAIQRQTVTDEDDEEKYAGPDHPSGNGRRLWDEVYTITYQRVDAATDKSPVGTSSSNGFAGKGMAINQNKAVNVGSGSSMLEGSWQQASLVETVLQGELPCDLDKSNPTYNILLLLRVLESLNHLAPQLRSQIASDAFAEGKVTSFDELKVDKSTVPQEEFLSSKLTPKLARQMQDALALCSGGLPAWCHQLTRACPFLFPFETRRQYFHSTAFGLSRALHRLQQQQSVGRPLASTERELRVGRLQRQKVRVSRTRILESAAKVMELYSGHRAVLEVEYFGEVGTGLGPTLEFYTLLSHELQKRLLDLWRDDAQGRSDSGIHDVEMQDIEGESGGKHTDQKDEYVNAPLGLFPRPWASNLEGPSKTKFEKVIEHFRLLGRVMAKALQDGRLLDLPLSMAFYKLVLGQELDLHDIKSIDPELGNVLHEMKVLVQRKQYLESALEISPEGNVSLLSSLTFRGSKIEDLCLDFTLPGYPNYVLKDGGNNIMVTLDNLEEYVSLVVDATLRSGIAPQMEAFRAGFNQVFLLSSLQIFNEDELDYLLCGRRELWTADSLAEHIKFDHGYNSASFPIKNLLEIMGELTPDEQRAFLRFVTGAPRLPPGGLAALNPKLTIVRKHPTGTNGASATLSSTPPGAISAMGTTLADRDLPSVMTCANYLKLPPYSCKEVMRERLLYAISEGQGSFDLS